MNQKFDRQRLRIVMRWWLVGVCGLPAALAWANEAASLPDLSAMPTYFYDANGPRAVEASDTEFVVKVKATAAARGDVTQRPAFLGPQFTPQELDPAAVRLEAQLIHRGVHVVRGASGAELANRAELEYALPVLRRVGSTMPIYPSDEVVVRFRSEVSGADVESLAAALGCTVRALPRGVGRYVLRVADPTTINPVAVANYLHERQDLTEYAEPDFFLPKITYSPPVINDPYYLSHQWHLDGDVLKGADPNSDINVEAAWDSANGPFAQGSPTVHVAIIDECVEKLHPDLFPNWRAGLDVDDVPYDDDPSPDGGQRHGTACAGLAVAKGNSIGVRGVAPECGLIGVKFFGGSNADTANAFLFCMDPDNNGDHSDGAAILSNSWGYGDGTLLPSDVVNAINTVAVSGRNGKGCLVLFASANNDHTVNGVQSLGQLATTTCVGGANSHAVHTEFSDVGPEVGIATPTNDRGDDGVRFPWLNITSVDNTGSSGYNGLPDLDYTNGFGGTSAATPIAAGAAALILSQDETMTAAEVLAILQHTAVRIDEPYGRFDGITGHSHRFGYGRADMGNAIAAAAAGMRWPDRIKNFSASGAGASVALAWSTPVDNYAGSLLVRSATPFAWTPTDGVTYTVGQEVAPGVTVIYNGPNSGYTDTAAVSGGFFYGVYARSAVNLYGFGGRAHIIRDGILLFEDNSEGADPGWTTGGVGNEWMRGTPTSYLSSFSQAVGGSGPLAGLRGTRAIGGNNCWATDLFATYDPEVDAWLQTPLINLSGVSAPVFLEYHDWCMLETFYDTCSVEVVDAAGGFIGYVDPDTGGDYDWTPRVYDLTPFAGQPIKVRFRMQSDDLLQRDGWFIDDVRVTVAANVPLPPTAEDVYRETTENTAVAVPLQGSDPNPGTSVLFRIMSLPAHGSLTDPLAGPIAAVPYTLASGGASVVYQPNHNYTGSDAFIYRASDGVLQSNDATVSLSIGTPTVIADYPLNSDPGWLTEGGWAFGIPLGAGGDPASGFTGTKVYGYNLAGTYPSDLLPERLTMLPLNCTGLSRVTLDFARWLGVEAGSFDNASIEATRDGVNWVTVWSHQGGDLQETSWSQQSYNIAAIADDQPFVQVRWTMGPTDGGSDFGGWNIDDVRISAIGTPQSNQPPLAEPVKVATALVTAVDITLAASDVDDAVLDHIITALPDNGVLFDPNGGMIGASPYTLAAGGNVVTYVPDTGFSGFDAFAYRAHDGELESNIATVTVQVLDPAPFPYVLDFESGAPLDVHWFTSSTNAGRIRVTNEHAPIGNYHLTMDSGSTSYSFNEATLTIDLDGASGVLLYYDWKDYGDETHALPDAWTGSLEGDGVAISADGENWRLVADLFDASRAAAYETVLIDLDQAIADAGLAYNKTFRIRFQQYDNNSIDVDGIALDNIRIVQGTGEPTITSSTLPPARLNEPYGPEAVQTIGGDLPLIWSMPIVFSEENLGAPPFGTNGVAQGWQGDDLVFDYTLPFAFPFYGQTYTGIKIATDGWINFGPFVGSTWNNSTAALRFNKRIAPLWDSLVVDAAGDIFIDTDTPGACTIRWDGITKTGGNPVNFSATLYEDGKIRFDYGPGNIGLTPTVGVGAGDPDGARYFLTSHDAAASLDGAASLLLDYGKLPLGLSMTPDGLIVGTPQVLGTFHPVFHIEDQRGRIDEKTVAITVLTDVFGDYDQDGDADIDDLVWLVSCLDSLNPSGDCIDVFDADGNEIVDLGDFAMFQASFTGP